MATEATTDVQKAETQTVATVPEQTRTGPVYSPAVDIFENDNSITLLADMPGVKASDLEIDLRENVLTLTGRVTAPGIVEGVERSSRVPARGRSSVSSRCRRRSISRRSTRQLADGVLRLELPKVEKARPRQITVRSS